MRRNVLLHQLMGAHKGASSMNVIPETLSDQPLRHPTSQLTQAALHGITRALASVGRAFVCLDPSFNILHASELLDSLLGAGAAVAMRGRPVEELLGVDLFGPR